MRSHEQMIGTKHRPMVCRCLLSSQSRSSAGLAVSRILRRALAYCRMMWISCDFGVREFVRPAPAECEVQDCSTIRRKPIVVRKQHTARELPVLLSILQLHGIYIRVIAIHAVLTDGAGSHTSVLDSAGSCMGHSSIGP
jgi:hypothetical protein